MEYLAPWPAEDEGAAASPPKGWAPHRRPRLPCRLFFTAFGKTLPMAHCNKLHDFAHKITIFSRDNTPEPSVRERVTVQCIRVWGRAHLLAFFLATDLGIRTYNILKGVISMDLEWLRKRSIARPLCDSWVSCTYFNVELQCICWPGWSKAKELEVDKGKRL